MLAQGWGRGQKTSAWLGAEGLPMVCGILEVLPQRGRAVTDAFQVCYNPDDRWMPKWEITMREKGSIIVSMLLGVALFAPSNVQAVPLAGGEAAFHQSTTTQQVRCRSSRRNRCYHISRPEHYISRPEQTTRHSNEYYPRSGWNGM